MQRYEIKSEPVHTGVVRLLEAAALPTSDLTDAHMRNFFFVGSPSEPIAVIGLEFCGPDALLRSLVVAESHRSSGLGAALTERAEEHAREAGSRSMFLLTTTAESFFAERGYTSASRESAPPHIAKTGEFADICPASSAFMIKHLG
jgi:amino-acid N-acetyltransferase